MQTAIDAKRISLSSLEISSCSQAIAIGVPKSLE
jgi:hypothetical protein